MQIDERWMRQALKLAGRGYGNVSPNPMVGAVLVRRGKLIGSGWHHQPGKPHAEIEALKATRARGNNPEGATMYVTLEPCCTHGRTPPCTSAIIESRIKRVVIGATDPNPQHRGRGFRLLRKAGVQVEHGLLADECERLNEVFNHWIVTGIPFVTVKAAMTMDGKIANAAGESKWITEEAARAHGMKLRQSADGILVGINTVLADDPNLTLRGQSKGSANGLRRFVLDAMARTPLTCRLVNDECKALTTIVVSEQAKKKRVAALRKRVQVLEAPCVKISRNHADKTKLQSLRIDLRWLLKQLGSEEVTHLLVEGGGEVNASFLFQGLAQRVAFFYAPKILGGAESIPGIGGTGTRDLASALKLEKVSWRHLDADLFLTARVKQN